ncbi:MAG TPA: hypothetical protein VGC10_05760 [Sphingomonas sp.]
MAYRSENIDVLVNDRPELSHALSSVSFAGPYLLVSRLSEDAEHHSNQLAHIGGHFSILFPEILAARALERLSGRYNFEGSYLGSMAEQSGYSAADAGPGSSDIATLRADLEASPQGLKLRFSGSFHMSATEGRLGENPTLFTIAAKIPLLDVSAIFNDRAQKRISELVERLST